MTALRLSLRYKIPLRSAALVVVTALLLTTSIIGIEYEKLRQDTFERAEVMGRILAETLASPLRHDDIWRVYEIIRTPVTRHGDAPDLVFLLAPDMNIYVASAPEILGMTRPLGMHGKEFARVSEAILAAFPVEGGGMTPLRLLESANDYITHPLVSDDTIIGILVMRFPHDIHWPRFVDIAQRAGIITLLVLSILLPLSWYWSRRIAEPLLRLAECMKQVGGEMTVAPDCKLEESNDEIGELASQFRRMLRELGQKQDLERQMLLSERLAALGRLSAGIAHEINNPLGGMLNAITTWKRHGEPDPRSEKTLALIERGLLQIRDTVSALLVEARPGALNLDPVDIEDVRRLVQPNLMQKRVHLAWDNRIEAPVPLPATLIRQIMINLLLNAMKAADEQGRIEVEVSQARGWLSIRVANDGAHIPPDRLPHLFEPFGLFHPTEGSTGHGLGLWMTYQIVSQLEGRIDVASQPGWIAFTITLPVGEA